MVKKVSLYQGSFKYRRGDNAATIPSLLRGSLLVTAEKDTDNDKWEKDIKEAVKFSFQVLREKLTLYMRLPMCAFPPS